MIFFSSQTFSKLAPGRPLFFSDKRWLFPCSNPFPLFTTVLMPLGLTSNLTRSGKKCVLLYPWAFNYVNDMLYGSFCVSSLVSWHLIRAFAHGLPSVLLDFFPELTIPLSERDDTDLPLLGRTDAQKRRGIRTLLPVTLVLVDQTGMQA